MDSFLSFSCARLLDNDIAGRVHSLLASLEVSRRTIFFFILQCQFIVDINNHSLSDVVPCFLLDSI